MSNASLIQSSGRVIAVGRLLLAGLFLFAIWADSSQPALAATETYTVLGFYLIWATTLTVLTWDDWWLDAKLSAVAHIVDIAIFTLMLFLTEGYTSPFFVFFVFLLLSAVIRWGWKETAATAAAVVLLYLAASLAYGPAAEGFQLQRFIIRTGHLLILSAILIWFGANQRIAWPLTRSGASPPEVAEEEPIAAGLRSAANAAGAQEAIALWRDPNDRTNVTRVTESGTRTSPAASLTSWPKIGSSILYQIDRDRALSRSQMNRWRFRRASDLLPKQIIRMCGLNEGLAVPVSARTGEGVIFLQGVTPLSTDHLSLSQRIDGEFVSQIQRSEYLEAVEESSMARARMAVSRDLHDNVVQFLAGLGFRLEALMRSAPDEAMKPQLADLKQLVLSEQGQLRDFIGALRSHSQVPLAEVSRDVNSLCQRLARQWDIACAFSSEQDGGAVPVRLHLDLKQLVREGVANAVRHGEAKNIAISLQSDDGHLCLTVRDDGRGFDWSNDGGPSNPPASLLSRVRDAGGEMSISTELGDTSLFMRLPMRSAQ